MEVLDEAGPPHSSEDIGPTLIAYVVCLVALSVVFIALRLYIRLRIIRNFGMDDWALVLTMVIIISCVAGMVVVVRFGLGRHMDSLSRSTQGVILTMIWFISIGYHFTIMVLKSAFLLQFRRAFPLPTFQRLCDIFLGFIACWTVAGIIASITICLPISEQWTPESLEPQRLCRARTRWWLAHGIMHVITDCIIFFMPLPLLNSLPMPRIHKIILIGVFGLGFLTCAISAARITTLHAALQSQDASWDMARTVFWTFGEVACAVLCLCIPTLRPLLIARCFTMRCPQPYRLLASS
ncbi:hypothetical protein B0I35DRAFT_471622 [Stachybotrys elegans]|uniref:Rhodopsin domain-containing protein n=1 Tax=Stachybotrys elegans TaxID=80388 RepID=A0A8K0SES8_9HYPO|nr:hypothetical protein B0I35DRAFT_471622 [Stachybotrys elegans]